MSKFYTSTIHPPKGTKASEIKEKYRVHFPQVCKHRPYSIIDSPEWHNSQFIGFYVLFWVVITVLTLRILLMNYIETGKVLQANVIAILQQDLIHVAVVDLVMYIGLYPPYFFQLLVAKGYVNWDKFGFVLQHLYQTFYLLSLVFYVRFHNLPWIGQIFLTLHALVQLMKMHSFSVYNGYMNRIRRMKIEDEVLADLVKQELLSYPRNLNLKDFFMYTMYPTVVYEQSYPRTEKIRWPYALKWIVATLGIFLVMIVVSEQMMHPIAVYANEMRQQDLSHRLRNYPIVFLKIFPPFILLYLLTFYIIWHSILNAIAELSMFGDREFYRDWWNSSDWFKFARDWNVPVHDFLQRHVYTSSRLSLNMSRTNAMFFTFLLSALVHELAMFVIFGRIRGFLFLMQLTQLPMQFLSEIPFMKQSQRLGLVLFWFGIALGPSILCSLYLTF